MKNKPEGEPEIYTPEQAVDNLIISLRYYSADKIPSSEEGLTLDKKVENILRGGHDVENLKVAIQEAIDATTYDLNSVTNRDEQLLAELRTLIKKLSEK